MFWIFFIGDRQELIIPYALSFKSSITAKIQALLKDQQNTFDRQKKDIILSFENKVYEDRKNFLEQGKKINNKNLIKLFSYLSDI